MELITIAVASFALGSILTLILVERVLRFNIKMGYIRIIEE